MTSTKDDRKDKDLTSLPPVTGRMRLFITAIFFLLGFGLAAFLFSNPFDISFLPGGTMKMSDQEETPPAKPEEATQLWTCPMHPQVMEKAPGKCPICGMELVPASPQGAPPPQGAAKTKSKGERKVKYWQAPMDPTYISDRPGKSPMGMDLVPVYEEEGGEGESREGVVKINPAIVQQIGVRTEAVRVGPLKIVIRTVGILDYNEKSVFWVNTKFDGWIEKVYVNYIGEKVRKGQRLFDIYSPELVSTQEEYLTAIKYLRKLRETGTQDVVRQAEALVSATRKRLAYWDITDAQIERLEKTRKAVKTLTVVSPARGDIIEKMDTALEGMYVKGGMNLYKVANLATVWVHADVYESQLQWVRPGLETEIALPYFPGRKYAGKVLYLYPFVSEKTRTMRACIEVNNPDGRLEPGMYADVWIKPQVSPLAVQVPEEAVIQTGERNVVFVALGEGRFMARDVVLGAKGEGGMFEIKEGLHEGERVVVSAQFMLDSESKLQEFIRKLMAPSGDHKS